MSEERPKRLVNDTRHPCSPGERSDPGDSGDKPTSIPCGRHRPPDFASLIRATGPSAPRAHRAQHRFAWPAVDLEAGGLLIRAERCTRLHARLAVELILVEADARQMSLHRLNVGGAQLRRRGPWRCERLRANHAV